MLLCISIAAGSFLLNLISKSTYTLRTSTNIQFENENNDTVWDHSYYFTAEVMTSVRPKINQREVSHHPGRLVFSHHDPDVWPETTHSQNPGKYLSLIDAMPQLHNRPVVFVLQHRWNHWQDLVIFSKMKHSGFGLWWCACLDSFQTLVCAQREDEEEWETDRR